MVESALAGIGSSPPLRKLRMSSSASSFLLPRNQNERTNARTVRNLEIGIEGVVRGSDRLRLGPTDLGPDRYRPNDAPKKKIKKTKKEKGKICGTNNVVRGQCRVRPDHQSGRAKREGADKVGANQEKLGPKGGGPEGWGARGVGPNIFPPFPRRLSPLFLLSLVSLGLSGVIFCEPRGL